MNTVVKMLEQAKIFYVATVDGDQPRVRPFGAVAEIDGHAYFCSNNTKDFFKQFEKNPKVEICGMISESEWVRVHGRLVRDDRDEARKAMLDARPTLSRMYKLGDGIFEVFRLEDAVCTKYSHTTPPEVLK